MEGTQGLQGFKIALLIDFDNVILGVEDPGFDIELVVNALRSRGSVVMGRAYGDWYRHNRHRRKLMEHGIELVETPVFGPVIKNSADIRIVLDGFEIAMLQHHIDAFCLVSGDSDFLPLIKKLQYLGKHVIVISGNKFTSDLVRRNCNEFVSYENLLAESLGATEDVSTLEGAFILLSRGISTLHERGMEVRSSTVKQMMLQLNPAFSERNFSCAQFKQFLDKAVRAGVVKLGGRDQVSGEFMVFLSTDFDEETPDSKFQAATVEPPVSHRRSDSGPALREPNQREARNGDRNNDRGRDRNRRRPERDEKPEDKTEIIALPQSETTAPADLVTTLADDVPTGEITPTTPSHLLNRGLRRGRLRFSGKAGRAEVAEDTAVQEAAPAPQATPEAIAADVIAPVADAETTAPSTIEAPEAALEVQAEKAPETEEAPKKRATRRGGKAVKAKAAKKAQSEAVEPASESASRASADTAPIETAAPTEAAPEPAVPATEEPKPVGKPRTTSGRKSAAKRTKTAAPAGIAPAEPAPEPAVSVTEVAAPNPIEVGLAASDNKPARRRSGRRYSGRKTEGEPGGNNENAS